MGSAYFLRPPPANPFAGYVQDAVAAAARRSAAVEDVHAKAWLRALSAVTGVSEVDIVAAQAVALLDRRDAVLAAARAVVASARGESCPATSLVDALADALTAMEAP